MYSAAVAFYSYLESLNLNSFYGRQASYEILTLILYGIGMNEIRYIAQKLPLPKLTWYYDAFTDHEVKQYFNKIVDGMEEQMGEHIAQHKEQLDYYLIHKEYQFVKKRILAQYLENERAALNQHYSARTVNLLNNIKVLENNNVKQEISKIAEETLTDVLATIKDSNKNQDILKASFESAISGLKSGIMDYKEDKVIPLFIEKLNQKTQRFQNITPEEEDKLFALTAKQKEYLASMDNRAAKDYAAKLPEVGTALANSNTYKEICERIKGRAEKL